MKKQLLISLSILSLVACTEETDDIYGTVDPQNKAFIVMIFQLQMSLIN